MTEGAAASEAAAADFVRRFAEYWRAPTPEALDTVLAQRLATERVTYLDSAPIVLTAIRRPRIWPAFMRSRLCQLRR